MPHPQVRFVVENDRVMIGEGVWGILTRQRRASSVLRRARVSTRLSTDKATSLHRQIRDEIPSQVRQPLPDPWPQADRAGKCWHRIVATALHLPGGPGGRPRINRQLFQCGPGKRHHQPWVGTFSAASAEAEQTSILNSVPFPGYPIAFGRQERSDSVDTLTELATKSKGCKDS